MNTCSEMIMGKQIIILHLQVFNTSLRWCFSLESERQQVSTGLQDSSQYSGQPQHCCSFNNLGLSSDFYLLQISTSSSFLGIVPSAPITIGIIVTFMFQSLFSFLARSKYLFLFSLFSNPSGWQSRLFDCFSFFCSVSLCLVLWLR